MKEKKSIIMFLIIVFALSGIVDFIWIRGGEAASKSGISLLLMWCPAVGAFIVRGRYYRKEKLLGWNKCKLSFILAAIFIPILYLALSYGIYWLINRGTFAGNFNKISDMYSAFTGKASHPALVITVILIMQSPISVITAAGEEIGWRGFLLPQMSKIWNFKTAVIVSGLIWAVWHMPIMLAGLYNAGTPVWYQLPMFLIDIMSFTVIISVLRLKSNSVWPAILLHASHNYFDQLIFGMLTKGANKAYFVGETGFITVIAIILAAVGTLILFRKNVSEKNTKAVSQVGH